jgi:hypothetical protein
MRIRITLEYDNDGQTIEQERADWNDGSVGYQDIAYLAKAGDDVTIKFETISRLTGLPSDKRDNHTHATEG